MDDTTRATAAIPRPTNDRIADTTRAADAGHSALPLSSTLLSALHEAIKRLPTVPARVAVGVSGASADTWMMRDISATGITVGAPPDGYNQMGQDWGQPPWRPDRLADTAYGPFRSMLQTALGHAGGVRIDHILGMFRLWWIPEGGSPREGT